MSGAVLPATGPGPVFAEECARLLNETYLTRIERAARTLPVGDLWWRPHEECTSVGNLLLHLEGNVRQWILSGLGGAVDRRERSTEFAARDGTDVDALLTRLRGTVGEACEVIAALPPGGWTSRVSIQGFETTPLGAVLHVVEHFSWHTGQVTWIAKLRRGPGHDVAFYDDEALNEARNPS
ncbi:MAG: DinB family protein [Planctomycetota bacterium]|jgi:uncharacterized damage-inducible protein DinB